MAKAEYDLVVIGGGAGGLVVAAGAATLGAKVALVEKHRLGGDCLWTGCIPSKTLLKTARVAHEMRTAQRWALDPASSPPDLKRVMEHVAAVVAEVAEHDSADHFRSLGVEVIFGAGHFEGPAAFSVEGRTLTARAFVLATGSRPAIPPIAGLADVPFLTNETIFDLREPVPSLAVLGAGPIGCELGQAFARLGSRVTLIDVAPEILPREDSDLAAVVRRSLEADGVACLTARTATNIARVDGDVAIGFHTSGASDTIRATRLLVAIGRIPNVEGLDLAAANVAVTRDAVTVNGRMQTTNPRIFAIGDLAGETRFTHVAEHHASIVLRQTLFRMAWAKPSTVVPWCTFTDPELARVGLSEREAQAQKVAHTVYRFPYEHNDRARTERDTAGFAKLLTGPDGRILGAGIVGSYAGELIAEHALAMRNGLKASALSSTIHAYPTWALTNRRVADQRLKSALTPRRRAWLKRIFGWRGS